MSERGRNPLFGDPPEAFALIQIDLAEASEDHLAIACGIILDSAQSDPDVSCCVGFGPTFFDRYTTLPRPKALRSLILNGDAEFGLEHGVGESDLLIAVAGTWERTIDTSRKTLDRLSAGNIRLRGAHLGYAANTQRDHSGFIDGTSNLQELSESQFSACVTIQSEDDPLFAGSSYLVLRKYLEDLEVWNDLPEAVQEQLIGRNKASGTFLSGQLEFSPDAWKATLPQAHIRCANPRSVPTTDLEYWKERIFRRGVKFTEKDESGNLHHGLLFIAVVRDPVQQFERIHNERILPANGQKDLFMSAGYVTPILSACYLIPQDINAVLKGLSS
jgi:Dyp-type peroxidase family